MNLIDTFKISKKDIITIVGAGGKTSLMYSASSLLRKDYKVLVTTTTHIYIPDKSIYDEINKIIEEFPNLKYHPEAVMNVLCNSATFALGQTDEVDYDAGFGIVNYERARKACENIVNQTLTSAVTDNQEIYQKNIVLNNSETINLQTTTLFNSNANDTSYSVNLSEIDFSNFDSQILNFNLKQNSVFVFSLLGGEPLLENTKV